jgi:hypothetical protein
MDLTEPCACAERSAVASRRWTGQPDAPQTGAKALSRVPTLFED